MSLVWLHKYKQMFHATGRACHWPCCWSLHTLHSQHTPASVLQISCLPFVIGRTCSPFGVCASVGLWLCCGPHGGQHCVWRCSQSDWRHDAGIWQYRWCGCRALTSCLCCEAAWASLCHRRTLLQARAGTACTSLMWCHHVCWRPSNIQLAGHTRF